MVSLKKCGRSSCVIIDVLYWNLSIVAGSSHEKICENS